MQLAPRPASAGPEAGVKPPAVRLSHFLAAGVVLAGAGVLTAGPAMTAAAELQHRALHLINTSDWSEVLSTAQQNIDTLQQEFGAHPFAALTQIGENQQDYTQLIMGMDDVWLNESGSKTITSGFEGFAQGWDQMLHGFPTHPEIPGLLDLPQAIMTNLANGDSLQASSDISSWLLFSGEFMLKPLVAVAAIPERMLENYTSVMGDLFGAQSMWDFSKAVTKAFTEPMFGVNFQYAETLGVVQAHLADGDIQGAFTALSNAPAQLVDALLNGYEVPETGKTFIGLLSTGGTLESLLVTWPQRIADDLTVGTADLPIHTTDAVGSGAETLLDGTGWDFTDFFGQL